MIRLQLVRELCDGYGVCADAYPAGIELDDLGYAEVTMDEVNPGSLDAAREAVSVCPKKALSLVDGDT